MLILTLSNLKSGSKNQLLEIEEILTSLFGQKPNIDLNDLNLADLGEYKVFSVGEWTWKVFQVHDIESCPEVLKKMVLMDRLLRIQGFDLLSNCFDQFTPSIVPDLKCLEPVVMDEFPKPSPISKTIERSEKKSSKSSIAQVANTPKISSFFSVLPKKSSESNEYFPPFQLRPNSVLSPINRFVCGNIKLIRSKCRIWSQWKIIEGANYRRPCTCFGPDGSVLNAVWKLLQFYEDYRPPYYGTYISLFKMIRHFNPAN